MVEHLGFEQDRHPLVSFDKFPLLVAALSHFINLLYICKQTYFTFYVSCMFDFFFFFFKFIRCMFDH
jgi:hypothetical protein